MVLTFGLCATFAFAQTQTATMRAPQVSKAVSTAAQVQNDRSSNLSIFTKDVTLLTVDFHDGTATNDVYTGTGYQTGKVTSGLDAHGQNYAFATWRRIANADSATIAGLTTIYNGMVQRYFRGNVANFIAGIQRYADTATSSAENGFMMMSMIDQTTANSGTFNAYIALDSVATTGQQIVDVNLYQYYRKFYDHCYIDYSTNGTSWTPVEVNVRNVDMAVNDILQGFTTFTLPLAAANQASLYVRIRYNFTDPLGTTAAYGYFWIIDDVSIVGGPQSRLKYYNEEYTEGNYGLIPQGLQLSPAWYTTVKNNGAIAQTSATVTVNHLDADQAVATPLATFNNGNIAAGTDAHLVCDPHGWYYYDSLEYRGWLGWNSMTAPHGTGTGIIPTTTAGTNYLYTTLTTDSLTHSFDTHYYNVTTLDNTIGAYRWGHDNGVLTYAPSNYWLFGYVLGSDGETWYVTEDAEDVDYYAAGYTVTSRFTTGQTVPEGWVVRGVELVASPSNNVNYHTNGAVIQGKLYKDVYAEGGQSVSFSEVATGAGVTTVTNADLNDSSIIGRNSHGYRELGQYNTIKIMFPEQPALEANTSYRVGYAISEDSYIALAHECLGSYQEASPTRPDQYDTILYFHNDPANYKYANRYLVNQYQTRIWDPIREGGSTFASWYVDYNPMIRLLVGPEQQVERVDVSIECEGEDYGEVSYGGQAACGTTVHPVDGSSPVFMLAPYDECMIAELQIDGVTIEPYDEETGDGDENYVIGSNGIGRYTFDGIAGNHTITARFMEDTTTPPTPPQSIYGVYSKVRMNLQPNPATSQVVLTVEGVNGMVNCAIIDMSGRVVYTAMVNTENAQVINLNNLAKGAYFVRITNSDFSKVEKLIVR